MAASRAGMPRGANVACRRGANLAASDGEPRASTPGGRGRHRVGANASYPGNVDDSTGTWIWAPVASAYVK